MPTVDERLASLEARINRMDDLHVLIAGVHTEMTEFRGDMNRQFTELQAETSRQFAESRADTNRRLDAVTGQVGELRSDANRRLDAVTAQVGELRSDTSRGLGAVTGQIGELRSDMNRRFPASDMKADRHFTWVVGIQMTIMLAILGAMVSAYYR
jgi:hypothetical protein